jgi:hypothetical protein
VPYYMLFRVSPGYSLDAPLGVHISQDNVNALVVYSSDEEAAKASESEEGKGCYMEEVTPADVMALAVTHGIDYIALDVFSGKKAPYRCLRAMDAEDVLKA